MATCNRAQRFLQRCCTPLFAEQRKWNISGNRMRIGYPISLRFFSEEVIPDQREETILGFAKPQVIEWSHDLSNKVSLMGTLTNGVDIKYLDSGKIVANCSIKVKCPPNIGTKEDSRYIYFLHISHYTHTHECYIYTYMLCYMRCKSLEILLER